MQILPLLPSKPLLTNSLAPKAVLLAALAIPLTGVAEYEAYDHRAIANYQQSDFTSQASGNQAGDQAQTDDKSKRKRKPNWNKLAKKLDLEDSQKAAFIEVMEAQHQQRVAIKKNSGVREAMQAVDSELQQSLASVLNEEQLASFIDLQQKRKEKRLKRRQQREDNSTAPDQQL